MDKLSQKFSVYYDYLDDIWQRVYGLVKIFVAFFIIGFFSCGPILKLVIKSFNLQDATIVATSPFQFFDLAMSVGVYTGFIACVPVFLYHMYDFLKSGLEKSEKKFFFVLLPIGFLLFCLGFSYGVVVLNMALGSIATINLGLGIKNFWDINRFLSQVIFTSTLLGVIFQFPIVLSFLVRKGFLSTSFLRTKRRHAIAAIFIVTSLLPPTDGLSLFIMVVPLVFLYEMTIWFNSLNLFNRSYIVETV